MDSQIEPIQPEAAGALVEIEQSRAMAEIQSALVMAKRFPRDQIAARDNILQACTRSKLAEDATYNFVRGGEDITGPTIRLAEVMAQGWGNMEFGIRELDQRPGWSTAQAFAWDLETNTRQTRVFQVAHVRETRRGNYALTGSRDIYETVANQGARRLRACILAVIPGDVAEAAVEQCENTLATKFEVTPDVLKKYVDYFEGEGISVEQIQKKFQCRIDSLRPAQLVRMNKIRNSIKQGMSTAKDWFEAEGVEPKTGTAGVADKLAGNGKPPEAPVATPLPDPTIEELRDAAEPPPSGELFEDPTPQEEPTEFPFPCEFEGCGDSFPTAKLLTTHAKRHTRSRRPSEPGEDG